MPQLRRQSLVNFGAPLCETIVDCPQPQGSEVLVRIERCGVCHSDLHLQDGYFSLGDGKKLDITTNRTLPLTLGHEIAGVVEAAGPAAQDTAPGRKVVVFPWIGCGQCPVCQAGDENLCEKPRSLGVWTDGGFASHVMVPHPRYLLDYDPLPAGLAATYMCSGVTAYSALKHLGEKAQRGPVLLVGMGGVGLMGLSIARAMLAHAPIVADIDPGKREAALAAGAAAAYDPNDPAARKELLAANGSVHAACDFVGSDKSLLFAVGVLARGGKIVAVGLLGGTFAIPATHFPMKAMTIQGSITGNLADTQEMMALARAGKFAPVPVRERPMAEAQAALDDLRAGRVVGRVVLTG
jgi:alcohol dehydrogenase